ncbi:hypothetical protein HanIR_Chr02g0088481 [Helianthus annuus]|nr:hypothetical protein HanIR_Chr02g0088481 [Helianthus annuus]
MMIRLPNILESLIWMLQDLGFCFVLMLLRVMCAAVMIGGSFRMRIWIVRLVCFWRR